MPDYYLEKSNDGPEGETSYSFDPSSQTRKTWSIPLRTKLTLGALALGGIVLGTLLFLFFLTAFVYLFIPAVIVLAIFRILSRRS